jgi:hypothetical protein
MVVKTLGQFEDNVSMSFGFVKKDIMAVNDSVNDLHEKIQHLSMNNAMLLDKILNLEKSLSGKTNTSKSTGIKPELEFYDVKTKTKFKSNEYSLKTAKGRKFAVAKTPSGAKAYRILGSTKKKKENKTVKKTKAKTSNKPKRIIKETTVF